MFIHRQNAWYEVDKKKKKQLFCSLANHGTSGLHMLNVIMNFFPSLDEQDKAFALGLYSSPTKTARVLC